MEIEAQNLPKGLRRKGLPEKLGEICRNNDVVFMAMFGSFVRDEQNRKSDIDIAIEFNRTKRKTLLDLARLEDQLSGVFRRKVDLGTFNSINPHIKEDVKKEMLVIYEKR